MNEVTIGVVVALLGAAGLVVALAHRRAMRDLARERMFLYDWSNRLERREAQLAADARAVAEWEGRLMQVAECGCCLTPRPATADVREDAA